MYKLTTTDEWHTVSTQHASRSEAIRHAFRACGLPADSWTNLGMDVNEIAVRRVTYRITDPDGVYRRYPRVR